MSNLSFYLQEYYILPVDYLKNFKKLLRNQPEKFNLNFNIDDKKGNLVFPNVSKDDCINIILECIDIVKEI